MGNRISSSEKEKVKKLLQDGAPRTYVAKIYGVEPREVGEFCNRHKITYKSLGIERKSFRLILNRNASAVVRMLMDPLQTVESVAHEFEVTPHSLASWISATGFTHFYFQKVDNEELVRRCFELVADPEHPNYPHTEAKKIHAEKVREEKRRSNRVPTIGEVQKEARKYHMTYGEFVSSPLYTKWRYKI